MGITPFLGADTLPTASARVREYFQTDAGCQFIGVSVNVRG